MYLLYAEDAQFPSDFMEISGNSIFKCCAGATSAQAVTRETLWVS